MQCPFESDPTGPVTLPPHGSTVVAEDLRVRLVLASDVDGDILIDGSQVESVGQAVIQLLLAAREEAERSGQAFTITNPSPALTQRLGACGLANHFGLEEEVQIQ